MTPEHIAAMEKAARIYCAKVGMDPNFEVPAPHETLQSVVVTLPFWKVVAERMVDLAVMLAAMKEAATDRAANDGATQH